MIIKIKYYDTIFKLINILTIRKRSYLGVQESDII